MNTPTEAAKFQQTAIKIGGMACSGCANTIQESLHHIEGVQEANVDLDNGSAVVTYNTDAVSVGDFKQVVEDAGYEFKGAI